MKSPRIWTVWLAVGLALFLAILFQVVFAAGLAMIELGRGVKPDKLPAAIMERTTSPYIFIAMMATGQLAMALGVLAAILSPVPFRQRVGLVAARPSWRVYPVAMFGSIVPLALGLAMAEGVSKIFPPDKSIDKFFENLTLDSWIVFVLFVGIAPAIFEEILFRGYMQQRLVKRWGALPGIVITSIVFGLFHIMPAGIAVALPLGFWFGYIAWRSESILPAMLCHFFVNAGLNLWRMIVSFTEPSQAAQNAFYIFVVLLGIICFAIACLPACWRGQKQKRE